MSLHAEVLARLHVVGRGRDGYLTAYCPAHEADGRRHQPSLSLRAHPDTEDAVYLCCFADCEGEALRDALGYPADEVLVKPAESGRGWWLCRRDPVAGELPVRHRTPEHRAKTPAQQGQTGVRSREGRNRTPEQPDGVTLAGFAAERRLHPALLEGAGVKEVRRQGRPCLEIPYLGPGGEVLAVRYRIAASGDRFRWRRGDKPRLYGLNRLEEVRRAGWVLLVEGESDCWACWQAGLPALGIPGKGSWRSEWTALLEGLEVVLWQEPDAADLAERLARDLPGLRLIVADGHKDPCAAHAAGEDLGALVARLRASAPLAGEVVARRRDAQVQARLAGLEAAATELLAHPSPLELVAQVAHGRGYGGDPTPVQLVYLAATTRLLVHERGKMPAHVLLLGPASAGKSFTLDMALDLLPGSAVVRIDAGSPRALIYSEEPLEHRVLVFGEADSLPAGEDNPAASAVRNLLQGGELCYDVVERDEQGHQDTRHIHRPGPTVLVTTSTRRLGPQLMTRLFELEIADEPAATAAAIRAQARLEVEGPDPAADGLAERLRAAQEWLQLQAPWHVVVPFAEALGEHLATRPCESRVMRDFPRLLRLIAAHALLCLAGRERDTRGRVVATLADYAAVRALVAPVFEASVSGGVSGRVRETVAAVAELLEGREPGATVSLTELARRLDLSKSATNGRVERALRGGWLVNDEDRRGRPARLRLGEPLPADLGLPEPDELGECSGVRSAAQRTEHQEVSDLQGQRGECSGVRCLTGSEAGDGGDVADDDLLGPPLAIFGEEEAAG